jgi:hypothetical protein
MTGKKCPGCNFKKILFLLQTVVQVILKPNNSSGCVNISREKHVLQVEQKGL